MQSNKAATQHSELTPDTARREFESLVSHYRNTALWYLNPDLRIELSDPIAETVLDKMAEKAPRREWLAIRELKKWRLQHFR